MVKPLLSTALWERIAKFFPARSPQPKGGRPWVPNRNCLQGIIFILRSGMPWEMLPMNLGYGSGVTCWRRLREWQCNGTWNKIHRHLLNELGKKSQIYWSRAVIDSSSSRAVFGGITLGQTLQTALNLG